MATREVQEALNDVARCERELLDAQRCLAAARRRRDEAFQRQGRLELERGSLERLLIPGQQRLGASQARPPTPRELASARRRLSELAAILSGGSPGQHGGLF
jgi:hypothetical protein